MLHFAYGSNMHRTLMRRHAPAAKPLGIAELAGHRFIITADGYASVAPKPGHTVFGVLWRITPRDRATLDAWESVAAGLYRAATLPVRHVGRCRLALVYTARHARTGAAKAGYMELVIAAAREWSLPQDYVASLQPWLPSRPRDAAIPGLGVLAWR
jgi:cation transport regulator ChaC